jgi:flagellar capping protein FliD
MKNKCPLFYEQIWLKNIVNNNIKIVQVLFSGQATGSYENKNGITFEEIAKRVRIQMAGKFADHEYIRENVRFNISFYKTNNDSVIDAYVGYDK